MKQVRKYFGATAKWAAELLSVSLAQVALPGGCRCRCERSAVAQQRTAHTQGSGLARLSCLSPVWPSPAGKASQPPVSPGLCSALREVFSEEPCSAAERRWHPPGAGAGFHRPGHHPVYPAVCPETAPSLGAASNSVLPKAGHGQVTRNT